MIVEQTFLILLSNQDCVYESWIRRDSCSE